MNSYVNFYAPRLNGIGEIYLISSRLLSLKIGQVLDETSHV